MASIIKRGEFQYQAKVRRKGYPVQTKTFERKQDALDWAATVESEMRRGIFIDRSDLEKTTLGEVLEAYRDEVVPRLKSRVSQVARVNTWLKHPLANRTLASLTAADFLAYIRQRLETVKKSTVRRDLMVIAAAFAMVRDEWEWPMDREILRVPLKRVSEKRNAGRRLAEYINLNSGIGGGALEAGGLGMEGGDRGLEAEKKLLAAAKAYSRDAAPCIILALETGMRRGELATLRWSQVNLAKKIIFLENTKNGESRSVPLTERAEETLRSMPRSLCGRVFSTMTRPDSFSQMFDRVCKRAGVSGIRFHDLRHEAASRFAAYMPTATLAKVMGWKSIAMAMRYYKTQDSELVEVVRNAERARTDSLSGSETERRVA